MMKKMSKVMSKQRTLKIEAAALTDRGQRRKLNEDVVLHRTRQTDQGESAGLYIVCDGLGGCQAGQVASYLAAETVMTELNDTFSRLEELSESGYPQPSSMMLQRDIRTAIIKAHAKLRRYAYTHQDIFDLGTTITLTLVYRNLALIANVGDSRAYLWRSGQMTQITQDHSLAAELARMGLIAESEIANHPRSNVLSQALGIQDYVSVDLFEWELQPGDKLMLCSDGLWKAFPDSSELAQWLESAAAPDDLCQQLVAEAIRRDGTDNVSIIVVNIDKLSDQQDRASDADLAALFHRVDLAVAI